MSFALIWLPVLRESLMRMPMPPTFLSSGDVRSLDPLSVDLMILTAPQSRAALSEARYEVLREEGIKAAPFSVQGKNWPQLEPDCAATRPYSPESMLGDDASVCIPCRTEAVSFPGCQK
jgi:hypothetical protein